MRIPDYRNVHGVKGLNQWTTKTSRVDKAHKDEFEKELEDSIYKRKSEEKKKLRYYIISQMSLSFFQQLSKKKAQAQRSEPEPWQP